MDIGNWISQLVGPTFSPRSFVLGIASGLAAAVLRWLVTTKVLGPSVKFPESISKLQTEATGVNASGWRYPIKIKNAAWRKLNDVQFVAQLTIQGLRPDASSNWTGVYIPMGAANGSIPRLRANQRYLFGLNVDRMRDRMTELPGSYWPENIRASFEHRTLTLDELMSIPGTAAKLRIFVTGYDSLSGTRKMFESKPYVTSDFHLGKYKKRSLKMA